MNTCRQTFLKALQPLSNIYWYEIIMSNLSIYIDKLLTKLIELYIFINDHSACSFIVPRSTMRSIWQISVMTTVISRTTFITSRNVGSYRWETSSITNFTSTSLQCCHNGRDGVSNHQPHDCLLNCLFRRRSKKTSKLCVTGLCVGNSPATGEFPSQMASNAENVSIWWRHHVT